MTTALTEERSVVSKAGSRNMRATWVGTPPKAAILSSAMLARASLAFQGRLDRCCVLPFFRLPANLVVGPKWARAEPAMACPPCPHCSPTSHWVMKAI